MPMSVLELSRWQFGITTVYHFIFVPLTIGLSLVVACMQTAWLIKQDPVYLRMTKFFGKIFLINFAVGVVTGIVQEFQFGMNWSAYSQFVGNVFGAPLAMEALLAFFMESTFIGLWIFGWNRLSPRVHLATIWLAAIGPFQGPLRMAGTVYSDHDSRHFSLLMRNCFCTSTPDARHAVPQETGLSGWLARDLSP